MSDWVFELLWGVFEFLGYMFADYIDPYISPITEEGAVRIPQAILWLVVVIGGLLLIWIL